MRISRDAGRNYPLRHEQDLGELPTRPAAVLIYGPEGTCRTLCLDFDLSRGGDDPAQAHRALKADLHTVQGMLHAAGASWVQDQSPSGGHHLYVPLIEPMAQHRARLIVEALGVLCPTIDPSPHRSIRHGCIRVPGSPHRSGGHQQLITDLTTAVQVLTHRVGPDAVERLEEELAEQRRILAERDRLAQTAPEHQELAEIIDLSQARATRAAGTRGLSSQMLTIATDGVWDRSRYDSASEARQAVLVAAAAAGMDLTEVQSRMARGVWSGLAQFYARYSPTHRQAALYRDWRNALAHLRTTGTQTVRRTNTSQPTTQGGASNYQFVRSWVNAVAATEQSLGSDRSSLSLRMLLRALAEAAMKTSSPTIAFGVRALAVATGTDAGSVSRMLKILREHTHPLIRLVRRGRGVNADVYELVIPEHLQAAATTRSWRPGKIHALRPVFRELGTPSALVFEALCWAGAQLGASDLVKATGLSRSTVHDAVATLASFHLIHSPTVSGRYAVRATDEELALLAEALGAASAVADQVGRYRAERRAWQAWLVARAAEHAAHHYDGDWAWELIEPDSDPHPDPPPSQWDAA